MDVRCILVAMLVYSSHGSALYWFAAMSLVTCVYESKYWFIIDAYLTNCSDRANIFISWRWLVLSMLSFIVSLWNSCFGGHPAIQKSCHHHVIRHLTYLLALNPSSWSGNSWLLSIFHENSQHRASSIVQKWYLFAPPIPCCPQAVPPLMALSP